MPRTKKNTLPSWYPLPIYQQTLTPDEWHSEIVMRATLKTVDENRRKGSIVKSPEEMLETFHALLVTRTSRRGGPLAQAKTEDFFPVVTLPICDLFFMAEHLLRHGDESMQAAHLHEKALANGGLRQLGEAGGVVRSQCDWPMPKSEQDVTFYMDIMGKRQAISVDLDSDDETLRTAFDVWLAGARSGMGPAPRPIGEKDFTKWKQYHLLAAFDLMFWSGLSGAGLTDVFIAQTLWPDNHDDFADRTERFRKVTRPMVAKVFDWEFVTRFWKQRELERSLDVLAAEMRAAKSEPVPE